MDVGPWYQYGGLVQCFQFVSFSWHNCYREYDGRVRKTFNQTTVVNGYQIISLSLYNKPFCFGFSLSYPIAFQFV